MKTKIALFCLVNLLISSIINGQSLANCNKLYLDTITFNISLQQDSIVSGNLYYMDTNMTVYPALHLILADTSIITSPDYMWLSFLDSGMVQHFDFKIHFKTTNFPNNTVVHGLFHIYDSDTPGDSIVTCYFPITIVLKSPTSSMNEVENNSNNYKLYPNPTNKTAHLEFENATNENCIFTLYDINGRLMRTVNNITADRIEIEKQNLTNGLYFFQVKSETQLKVTGKLSIE